MIELKVSNYCQDCPEFDPDVDRDIFYADGESVKRRTVVFCTHRKRCESIAKTLLDRFEKEMKVKLDKSKCEERNGD